LTYESCTTATKTHLSALGKFCAWKKTIFLKARINSIGKARENSIVRKDVKVIKKMLKFFLERVIKEELLDDRNSYVHNNRNTMEKAQE